ncbi:MAG TPA: mechanosensitive ion channel family protein [Capsulimonadaceae bacterium]|jgi:small conductance mechanosensitive channel
MENLLVRLIQFSDKHFAVLPDVSLDVLQVVVFYTLVRFIINAVAGRIAEPIIAGQARLGLDDRGPRVRTLTGLIRSVGNYVLNFVFAVMLLRALRFDAVSVVSTAGFAGLAFGFGAQKLVKDVINGFFLIMENQYDAGDYVTINGITGIVEEIGMRIMKIRDDSGKLYILSNGDISQVCNMSRGSLVGVLEIGIANGEDLGEARSVIEKAGQELLESKPELGIVEPPTVQGIGTADAAHVVLRIPVKVEAATKLGQAQIELRGLARERLHEAGIYIA